MKASLGIDSPFVYSTPKQTDRFNCFERISAFHFQKMLSRPRFATSWMHPLNEDFIGYLPHSEMIPADLSTPIIKENTYRINLDLRHFSPDEISVKCEKNLLHVSGKHHKESEDGKHQSHREYSHCFTVPDNVEAEQLKCQLDPKGFLRIEAPLKGSLEDKQKRNIPIEYIK